MSFFIYHRYGDSERDPAPLIFPALLDELEVRLDDREHNSISVIHESEWGFSIFRGGYVIFENVERDDEPRHMRDVPREKMICLMQSLALGDFSELEKEPWLSGC